MNKKLLLSGLLILNFFVTPLALAETIDENIQNQTKKIENLQADQKKLAQEVEQLNKNINKYQTKYDETLAQKNEAEVKVNELSKKSVELQEKIEKRSEKIRDLARSTQLNQKSDTMLSALLEAKSVDDLVNKSFAIFTFVQANQNLLAQQEADQKELQKTKEQAEQNLQTINDSIADLQKTNEQLVNAKLDLNVKQNELNTSLASEQAKKDEFIKQKEAAEKAKQEAAAKLKAQQEAAARAQQEAAQHAAQQATTQTSAPTSKLTNTISQSLRDFVTAEPICSPTGVMDKSVPRVNKPMPNTNITAPTTNAIKMSVGTEMTEKHKTNTIAVIGSTELSDSFTLAKRTVRVRKIKNTTSFDKQSVFIIYHAPAIDKQLF